VDQALPFAQLDKQLEPKIDKLFKQTGSLIKLDLKEVLLLDSQYTMDLFCKVALGGRLASQDPICDSRAMAAPWYLLERHGWRYTTKLYGSAPDPSQTSLHFAI
jgi:hypothetical protein